MHHPHHNFDQSIKDWTQQEINYLMGKRIRMQDSQSSGKFLHSNKGMVDMEWNAYHIAAQCSLQYICIWKILYRSIIRIIFQAISSSWSTNWLLKYLFSNGQRMKNTLSLNLPNKFQLNTTVISREITTEDNTWSYLKRQLNFVVQIDLKRTT